MFLAVPLVGIIGAAWRNVLTADGEVPRHVSKSIEHDDTPANAILAPETPPGSGTA
jgi:hypothetical protein